MVNQIDISLVLQIRFHDCLPSYGISCWKLFTSGPMESHGRSFSIYWKDRGLGAGFGAILV